MAIQVTPEEIRQQAGVTPQSQPKQVNVTSQLKQAPPPAQQSSTIDLTAELEPVPTQSQQLQTPAPEMPERKSGETKDEIITPDYLINEQDYLTKLDGLQKINGMLKNQQHKFMSDTNLVQYYNDRVIEELEPYRDRHLERMQAENERMERVREEIEKNKPSWLESSTAMLRKENTIAAIMARAVVPHREPDPNYNVREDPLVQDYLAWSEVWEDSQHPDVTAAVIENLQMELHNQDVLARTGTALNIFNGLLSGIGDPTTLLSLALPQVGLGVKGGRLVEAIGKTPLRTFGYSVGTGVALTAIQEVILHSQQDLRTLDESALNLTADLLLNSALGGLSVTLQYRGTKAYERAREQTKLVLNDTFEDVVKLEAGDVRGLVPDGDLSAAIVRNEETKPVYPEFSLNPVKTVQWALGSAALKASKITPLGKAIHSRVDSVRKTMVRLAETNMLFTDSHPRDSVEMRINGDLALVNQKVLEIRKKQAEFIEKTKMPLEEFQRRIDAAGRNADLDADYAEIGEITAEIRGVFAPYWKMAADFQIKGTFEDGVFDANGKAIPTEQTTALSYWPRRYDRAQIEKHKQLFFDNLKRGAEESRVRNNNKVDLDEAELIDSIKEMDGGRVSQLLQFQRKGKATHTEYTKNKLAELNREIVVSERQLKKQDKEIAKQRATKRESQDIQTENNKLEQLEKAKNIEIKKRTNSDDERKRAGLTKKINSLENAIAKKKAEIQAIRDSFDQKIKTAQAKYDANVKNIQIKKKELKEFKAEIKSAQKKLAGVKSQYKNIRGRYIEKYEDIELNTYAREFYYSVAQMRVGDSMPGTSSLPTVVKHRQDINDEFLQDFFLYDWESALENIIQSLVPKIRMVEKFGEKDGDYMMTRQIEKINNDYIKVQDELTDVITEKTTQMDAATGAAKIELQKEIKRLGKEREALYKEASGQIENIKYVRDTILGFTAEIKHPRWVSLARTLRHYQVAIKLGSMAISSIAEMGKLAAVHGMRRTLKTFFSSDQLRAWRPRDLPKAEAAAWASATVRVSQVNMRMVTGQFEPDTLSWLERGGQYLGSKTNLWGGQQTLDSMYKGTAGLIANHKLAEFIKNNNTAKLTELGFTPNEIEVMRRNIKHFQLEDNLYNTNIDRWDLSPGKDWLPSELDEYNPNEVVNKYVSAIVYDANTTVLKPGGADIPRLMGENEWVKSFLQFKSFLIASHNRTLIPTMQGDSVAAFRILTYANAFAVLSFMIYMHSSGREIDWNDEQLAWKILDRSGTLGYLGEVVNTAEAVGGFVGPTGLPVGNSTRFYNRNIWGTVLGPMAGTAEDFVTMVTPKINPETGEYYVSPEKRLNAARKMIPFQNHWAFRRALDKVVETSGEALD